MIFLLFLPMIVTQPPVIGDAVWCQRTARAEVCQMEDASFMDISQVVRDNRMYHQAYRTRTEDTTSLIHKISTYEPGHLYLIKDDCLAMYMHRDEPNVFIAE